MTALRLGGHLRADDGLRYVPIVAAGLEYNLVQIHAGPSTGWEPYNVRDEDAEEFQKAARGLALYVHMPYTLNPCEGEGRLKNFHRITSRKFIRAAQALGAKAVVLHPGHKKNLSPAEATKNLREHLTYLLEGEHEPEILLETDAGSKNGSAIGSAETIAETIADLNHPKLGMCVDTCHLYARGTNLWDDGTRTNFLQNYHHLIRLIHLNAPDPSVEPGSHLDRHDSPFEDFRHPSEELIKTMTLWPCVLERRSIGVQRQDAQLIRRLRQANAA